MRIKLRWTFHRVATSENWHPHQGGYKSFLDKPSGAFWFFSMIFFFLLDSSTKLGFVNLAFVNTRPYEVIVRSTSLSEPLRIAARSYVEKQVRQIAGKTDDNGRLELNVSDTDGNKEFVNGFYGTIFIDSLTAPKKEGSQRKSLYIGQKSKAFIHFFIWIVYACVVSAFYFYLYVCMCACSYITVRL